MNSLPQTDPSPGLLAQQVMARCALLAGCTDHPGTITRTFLSPATRDCHRILSGWMRDQGCLVSTDAMGNLRGLWGTGARPRLVIGSHIDTVPDAGAYDGVLGLLLALAVIEASTHERWRFDVEVIAFSEEEGVRFGIPFLGSRAFTSTADAQLLSRCDAAGVSVAGAIRAFGLQPELLADARYDPRSFAYLEFHIEQGPILDVEGLSLATVEGIVGQSRRTIDFIGAANHAGTTPLALRKDALAGAAEWMVAVERFAAERPGLLATIGRLNVLPGAANVVPGRVSLSLDVRHASDEVRRAAVSALLDQANVLCERRSLDISIVEGLEQATVALDPTLGKIVDASVTAAQGKSKRMLSGAGHDAMIVAPFIPSAMIFLRSPAGISHHPSESVRVEDVTAAIEAGQYFLQALSRKS